MIGKLNVFKNAYLYGDYESCFKGVVTCVIVVKIVLNVYLQHFVYHVIYVNYSIEQMSTCVHHALRRLH